MKSFKLFQRFMIHPLIYLTAFRLMVALIFLLGLPRLISNGPSSAMIAGFLAALFALFAYLVYLRMDGLRIPRVKYIRPKRRKDPLRSAASMSDYADEAPPVAFDELEPEERDLCSFIANLVNLVVFLVLSFVL